MVSLVLAPLLPLSAQAVTGVPKILSYQGRLTNASGDLLGGVGTSYYFKFSIWDSPTSSPATGTQLWPSASSSVTTSTVTSGVFNVQIGDTANGYPDALTYDFYENRDVYLQVEVSSNGSSFETLAPRQRIAATGFAISAETVTGKLYASSTSDYTFNVTNEGSGRANLSTEGQVQIGGFTSAPTTIGGGSLYYNSNTGQLFVWDAATSTPAWVSLGGGTGGSTDLQAAYNLGNSITTTNARNILFTSADTATDSNFVFNILGTTSTARFEIQASGTPVFSVSRTSVTSTASLTTLATTTVTGTLTANIFTSSGATLTGGAINNTPIGASGASTATFTSATTTGTFAAQGVVSLATTTIPNTLTVQGSGTALSVTNSASVGDALTVTNALSAGSLNTAGTLTANLVNATSSLRVNNIERIAQGGQGTFTTTSITSLQVSGTSTFTGASSFGTLAASTLTLTNALGIAQGGTATTTTPANGELLIGNGTNYALATLTPGTAIGIQNAAGSITVTNLGVQSLTGGTGISVNNATGTVTLTNTRPFVTSTINGVETVAFTFATTTSYTGGFNISTSSNTLTWNFPGRINDINTLATSTGNLIVASGTTWVAKSVGTNGFVLTASSTAASGLSWEPASASGITSLNGSTSSTQTFASANNLLVITTSNGVHTFTATTTPSFTSITATGSSTISALNFTTATGTSASIGSVLYNSSGISPAAAFTIGAVGQNLTLQGATTTISAASPNSIVFQTGGGEKVRIASSGQVMVNTTATSTGQVNIVGTASGGATVTVAGLYQESLLNPSASGEFQFGNRHIINVAPTASSSLIGDFVRTIDNTTLNNTVRAMELQAWSGTNVQGINTGLFAAGRTFGVQAISNGTAGGIAAPAAIFGEITTSTQGQALRLYSQYIASSSQDLALFYQEVSSFQGTGLKMDFARTGGTFTGNYLNFLRNATSVFAVNATGSVAIGTSTPYGIANLTVCAQSNCSLTSATDTVAIFASVDGTTATRSITAKGTIVSQLADVGEYVPVEGKASDYKPGDLLSVASSSPGPIFGKSRRQYDANLVGIVTPASAFIAGGDTGGKESVIMALSGRVTARVSGENGPIVSGDLITASSESGVGMRATGSGRVIGVALTSFNGTSGADAGTITIFVNPHHYYQSETAMLQGGVSGSMEVNTYTFDTSKTVTVGTLVAGKVKTQNLEVGASAAPSGITLYDTKTGEPYCVIIESGTLKSYPGICDNLVFIPRTAPLAAPETSPASTTTVETATTTTSTATTTPTTATTTTSTATTTTSTATTTTSTTTTTPTTATTTTSTTTSTPPTSTESATTTTSVATTTPTTATTTEPVIIETATTTTTTTTATTAEPVVTETSTLPTEQAGSTTP